MPKALSKSKFIEYIEQHYKDNDLFEFTIQISRGLDQNSMSGIKFGSAEYLIRRSHFTEKHEITLNITSRIMGNNSDKSDFSVV